MSRSRVLFKDFTVIKLLLSAGTLGGFIAPFLEIDPAVLQAKDQLTRCQTCSRSKVLFIKSLSGIEPSRWICYASLLRAGCVTESLDYLIV